MTVVEEFIPELVVVLHRPLPQLRVASCRGRKGQRDRDMEKGRRKSKEGRGGGGRREKEGRRKGGRE